METETKVSLKLLINKETNKVLFAEAGKDFVDFLFTLLSLLLGTVIRLLSKKQMVGCLGTLYQSIEELSDNFIQPSKSKDAVLKPKFQSCTTDNSNFLLTGCNNNETSAVPIRRYYVCSNTYSNHRNAVADDPQANCPSCNHKMRSEVSFVATAAAAVGNNQGGNLNNEGGGFVKGVVTYMVMDDLEVKPMSTISSITLLNKFNIQQVGSLEEKVIELGMDEGLKLLKASLQSKTVLTNVFLGA